VIEALSLGADRCLAANAAGLNELKLYSWLNFGHQEPDGPYGAFRVRACAAEEVGKGHLARVEKMRTIVAKHDEALVVLEARAKRFVELRAAQRSGSQLGLL
jgi:hypothetical protein